MLKDNARLGKVPPPFDFAKISKSCLKRNDRSKSQKNKNKSYHVR